MESPTQAPYDQIAAVESSAALPLYHPLREVGLSRTTRRRNAQYVTEVLLMVAVLATAVSSAPLFLPGWRGYVQGGVLAGYCLLALVKTWRAWLRFHTGADMPPVLSNMARSLRACANFGIDLFLVATLLTLGVHLDNSRIYLLLILATVRFLTYLIGPPSIIIFLLMALPLSMASILFSYSDVALNGDATALYSLLVTSTVVGAYVLSAMRIAVEQRLSAKLAERTRMLEASEYRAEQNARRLAEHLVRLSSLQAGLKAVNSTVELEQLLQMIVDSAVRVLKVDRSSIGLVEEASGELVIQSATGVNAGELRRRRFPPGVGVAGWVIQHGKVLNIPDVAHDPRYIWPDATEGPHTVGSVICVPLLMGGKVLGALTISSSRANALSEDDENMLTTFAEQAVWAVYKSRLLEERTRHVDELTRRGKLIASLDSISQAILRELDLNQVLNTALGKFDEVCRVDNCLVYLATQQNTLLELVAARRTVESYPRQLSASGNSEFELLWREAEVSNCAQRLVGEMQMLCLRLAEHDQNLGCIIFARGQLNQDPFTLDELSALTKLASATTIAIVNARLFSQITAQKEQASRLYGLMSDLNAAENRQQIAAVICNQLQHIIRAPAAALLVHDSAEEHLQLWAASGEWDGLARNIAVETPGNDFVSNILRNLQQLGPGELLVSASAPRELASAIAERFAITIPLANAGRLIGLLVVLDPERQGPRPGSEETLLLALAHSAVALEHANLSKQALENARQASMLYNTAARINTWLNWETILRMTVSGALRALPIETCEVYLLDAQQNRLQRADLNFSYNGAAQQLLGPETIELEDNELIQGVLATQMVVPVRHETLLNASTAYISLRGTGEVFGLVRLTTRLRPEHFVRRYATFCQTLLSHASGALERSRLFTTVNQQTRRLNQRTGYLTELLNVGDLPMGSTLTAESLSRIAAGMAQSLGLSYVIIGEMGPHSPHLEVRFSAGQGSDHVGWATTAPALSPAALRALMHKGSPAGQAMRTVQLDAALLDRWPLLDNGPAQALVTQLQSRDDVLIGYLGVVMRPAAEGEDLGAQRDRLEALELFAQRIELILNNQLVYNQVLASTRELETIVRSISDGVIVTDAALNIRISNRLADQLLDLTDESYLGKPLAVLTDNEPLLELMRECVASGQSASSDLIFARGGTTHTYDAIVHPLIEPDTGSAGVVLTLRDVTEERAIERDKTDFLSIVSHELRTPLNSVLNFIDVILMGKTGPLTALQQDFLDTAKQEARILHRLINDLLDSSRIQSGKLAMEMTPLNLTALLERVYNRARQQSGGDEAHLIGITIVNQVRRSIVTVGDEIRLEQVFANLLNNALKFTDEPGVITIDAALHENRVLVTVSDTGGGIPAAHLDKVFERFYQSEHNKLRTKRGLGLGLPICKYIVESHEGRIWIESEIGQGTTVFVELPLFNPERFGELHELYSTDLAFGSPIHATRDAFGNGPLPGAAPTA